MSEAIQEKPVEDHDAQPDSAPKKRVKQIARDTKKAAKERIH